MATAGSGVFLAFDGVPDASGAPGRGIGPYDEIVLRGARAVGERAGLGRIVALRSSGGRWRDAETEPSSAESEQLEIGRGEIHVSAGSGKVVVRFSADEVTGASTVPDLGPFGAVVVGTHEVRGDDEILAVRVSRISPWQLTDRVGPTFQGALKEALVFVASGADADQAQATAMIEWPATKTESADVRTPTDGAGEDVPSVWVDRVKAAPDIYISRPDRKR